jgi:hypothetical protein
MGSSAAEPRAAAHTGTGVPEAGSFASRLNLVSLLLITPEARDSREPLPDLLLLFRSFAAGSLPNANDVLPGS